MFDLLAARASTRFCDRISRRKMLEVGALTPLALTLPGLIQARADASADSNSSFGRVKRVILLFMWGGPAHQDTWDLKPDGPSETRGEFLPIATNVPGVHISEHFPLIARHADKLAIIRSVGQGDNNHLSAASASLTGRRHPNENQSVAASENDFPQIGAVLSRLRPIPENVPPFVALPERIHVTDGTITPGQDAGFLGKLYDPFQITDHPDRPDFSVSSLRLPSGMTPARLVARRNLQQQLTDMARRVDTSPAAGSWNSAFQRALDMVLSSDLREAFDLSKVADSERWRYGWQTFGQSVLLARRLIEAGVQLVTVYWHREKKTLDTTWDTHSRNFEELKNRLMPSVDRPIAALLEDLATSGLLDETLVIWNSEFGRTPRINSRAGRDHWGPCNSVVMAGGGLPGGQVFGKTDSQAAYPIDDVVTQADIAATVYHLLGLDPHTPIYDSLNRPYPITLGRPIEKLLSGSCRPPATSSPQLRSPVREISDFARMLKERSNRFLHLACGYSESEGEWEVAGFASAEIDGPVRQRTISRAGRVKYLGVFNTHFDYTHLVFRLAEARTLDGLRLAVRDRVVTLPDKLTRRGAGRIWQIPFPEGLIRQIPFSETKAFDLKIETDGWKIQDIALVGSPIEPWHLKRLAVA